MFDEPRRQLGACVVLLAQDGELTNALYHALSREVPNVHAILEDRIGRVELLRGRARRFGWRVAAGQAAFTVGIVPVLRLTSRARIAEIHQAADLKKDALGNPIRVPSVNHEQVIEWLDKLAPVVIVIFGTRILSRKTLSAIKVPVLNLHAGITPLYRGVHGAYWALVEGRPDLVGSTVHFVDEGIDTGRVVSQAKFDISHDDNFATYPHLHFAAGLPLLLDAVHSLMDNDPLKPATAVTADHPSILRSHPTVASYISARFRLGVS
ncbi:MAG: hypothetical protein DLM61_19805 [Pseudonocardiales bacterium]|nr:MAG: hypothetical protein DLM61_19805 [Pseudonocardiales bacterium]